MNDAGTRIISGSRDKSLRLWSIRNGECIAVLTGHTSAVSSVNFIDQVIISGSIDKSMIIWNPSSEKALRTITEGVTDKVYDIQINSDESLIACFYRGLTLYSWPKMNVVRSVDVITTSGCFHPSNPDILAIDDDNDYSIHIYHITKNEIIHTFKGHNFDIQCLSFSPDGYRLISGSWDNTTRIWDTSDI